MFICALAIRDLVRAQLFVAGAEDDLDAVGENVGGGRVMLRSGLRERARHNAPMRARSARSPSTPVR